MNKFWQFKNIGGDEPELLLYGPISETSWWGDEITPKQFAEDLKALGNISNLTVRINSSGGDVFAAQAIYTMLKDHPANVIVKIDGVAASAATVVAMAGDIIKAPANAMLMIHNPLVVLWGMYNANELEKMADVLDAIKESIINAYVAKTKRDRKELSKMMDRETWMTAEEAKAEGFVDEILFEESVDASATNDGRYLVVNSVLHDLSRYQTRPLLDKKVTIAPNIKPVILAANKQAPKEIIKEGDDTLEIKTIDELKQQYPELCNQLVTEAKASERERIKSIDEIAASIDPVLVAKAKYEEPMTAQELAYEALKADAAKGRKYLNDRDQEIKASGVDKVTTAIPEGQIGSEDEKTLIDKIVAAANQKRAKEVKK
ncbi:MAG: Clp protease ClpP [Thermoanaerobacter sp.]|nr:Clp protease ClpP [Thermoanaerobacter sp.]